MNSIARMVALCLVVVVASGCVARKPVEFNWQGENRRILLMPTDIQLSELNAGGLEMPNAEWTANAETFFLQSVRGKFAETNAHMIEAANGLKQPLEQVELMKLHEAVGLTIRMHALGGQMALPTKAEKPTWTLGPSANKLKQRYGADYALFVHVRDSYASGGRAAAMIVAAAFGVGMQGGRQHGFASLVDLSNGEVVWHNFLLRGKGNMRTLEGAKETTDALLKGLPG